MSGRIEFGSAPPRLRAPVVQVWIEDTTYADAPAIRLAERRMTGADYDGDPDGIPFTIEWDERQRSPGHTYSIAALVDVDRDGRAGPGDYLCTEAVTVPPAGTPARVRVQRIG